MQTFNVTENHLKLLKGMNISWDDCEFGAPCVDPKRPYGNSSVREDMAELLELELFVDAYNEKHLSKEQVNFLDEIHYEMKIVLQILVSNLEIKVGEYQANEYSSDWKFIN